MEEKLRILIKKYSVASWYQFLDRILKDNSSEWSEKRREIFLETSSDRHIQDYIIARLLQIIILHADFNKKINFIESNDIKSALLALNKLINIDENINLSLKENIDTNLSHARTLQSIHHVTCKTFLQLHRICFLFGELSFSSEMIKYNDEHKIDLKKDFHEIFNVDVDTYLKFCFLFFSHFMHGSSIEIKSFINSCNTLISKELDASSLLQHFYSDRETAKLHEISFSPLDSKFKYNSVPLLKINPGLKSDYDNEEIYVPFLHLISARAIELVYFELHKKHKKSFSSWFGRLFEQYCDRLLRETFCDAEVISVDTLSYKHEKKPDFIVLKGTTAILIECKAIRIYRSFTESDDKAQIKETFSSITNAQAQLSTFKSAIQAKNPGLEKFQNVKDFYGVIVIWEEFSPRIDDFFIKNIMQYYNNDFKDTIQFKMFSINMLEHLQASLTKSQDPFNKFIALYSENFNEQWKILTSIMKIKDSFLDEYFTQLTKKWIPSKFMLQT